MGNREWCISFTVIENITFGFVSQLDREARYEREGWGFDSLQDHYEPSKIDYLVKMNLERSRFMIGFKSLAQFLIFVHFYDSEAEVDEAIVCKTILSGFKSHRDLHYGEKNDYLCECIYIRCK